MPSTIPQQQPLIHYRESFAFIVDQLLLFDGFPLVPPGLRDRGDELRGSPALHGFLCRLTLLVKLLGLTQSASLIF